MEINDEGIITKNGIIVAWYYVDTGIIRFNEYNTTSFTPAELIEILYLVNKK